MADELDIMTQETMQAPPERNSGHNQSASLQPTEDPEVSVNLDHLFEQATGQKPPVDTDPSKVPDAKPDKKDEEKTADDAATGLPDPVEKKDEGDVDGDESEDGDTPKEGDTSKEKEDETEDGDTKAGDEPDDDFKKIALPPHTSQKASDSFNAVKEKARAEISQRESRIAELQSELDQLKAKETITPEEKSELEELRKLRGNLEIEKDPQIVGEFDRKITANDDIIYKTLKEVGMKDSQIQQIKDMGGPVKLGNWDAIYEHMTPSQKRVVDGRLNENERLLGDRDHKIAQAKSKVDEYLASRSSASKETLERESQVITESANEMLQKVEWSAEREIPATATEAERKAIEEANKWSKTQIETLKGLLSDRSPENHATLAFGTVQALHFRKQLDAAHAELKTLRDAHEALEQKMAKIKKAGSSRRSGGAPATPVKPSSDIFTVHAEDHLDRLREEVENKA